MMRNYGIFTAMVLAGTLAVGGTLVFNAPALHAEDDCTEFTEIDVATVATGERADKLIGRSVVNDKDDGIGKIDDLIIGGDDEVVYAILSVGGFLGINSKLIAVPFDALEITGDKVVLPNARKADLETLPSFKYAQS